MTNRSAGTGQSEQINGKLKWRRWSCNNLTNVMSLCDQVS